MMRFVSVLLISSVMMELGDCMCCFQVKQYKSEKSCNNAADVTSDFPKTDESRLQMDERDVTIPGRPEELRVEGRTLTWQSSEWKVRNYLLKIEREITVNGNATSITTYTLLGPLRVKKRAEFFYNCTGITDRTKRVTFTLWALSAMNEPGPRIYKISGKNHASLTWKPIDPRFEQARKDWDDCVCKTQIMKIALVPIDDFTLTSVTTVRNNQASIRIQFYLNRNQETINDWLQQTDTSKNITHIRKQLPTSPGEYVLVAQKKCPGEKEYWRASCDKDPSVFFRSDPITVLDATFTELIVSNSSRAGKALPVPMSSYLKYILPISVGVGAFVLVVIAVLLVKLGKGKKMKNVWGTPNVTTSLLGGSNENESVAVIYANDSQVHRSRVYDLCAKFKLHGIDACAIDEHTRHKEMVENWIAEGEKLSNTYKNFLFVLSPSLIDACITPGNSDTGTRNSTDETAPPVGHSKLPLVILNSIKPRVLQFDLKNIQTVHFNDSSIESIKCIDDLFRRFSDSHRSIVHSEVFRIKVKDQTIVEDRMLAKLMISCRGNDPKQCVVDLDTVDKGTVGL